MKCLIIEDEFRALRHLEAQLLAYDSTIRIAGRLDSVEESVNWLAKHEADLIFMDVELGDGTCFQIFEQITLKTPVIFTTSYHQYLNKAFEANSIAYLLKPVNLEELRKALKKYDSLYNNNFQKQVLDIHNEYQKRFLVQTGNTMLVINIDKIAYFKVEGKRYVVATTFDKEQHLIDGSLEDIEKKVNPASFFRINRQFIINLNAIIKMSKLDKGRVKIDLKPDMKEDATVSVDRAAAFRKWLEQ